MNFWKKNKTLIRWVISYMLILLFPVVCGILMMENTSRLMIGEYKRINSDIQNIVDGQINSKLGELKQVNYAIRSDQRLTELLPLDLSGLQYRYRLADAVNVLKGQYSVESLCSNYLYFHDSGILVSNNTVIEKNFGWMGDLDASTVYQKDLLPYLNFSDYDGNGYFQSVRLLENPNNGDCRLMLVTSLPFPSISSANATLFQVVSASALTDVLKNAEVGNISFAAIISGEGQIISQTGTDAVQDQQFLRKVANGPEYQETTLNGETFLVFCKPISCLEGYSLFTAVPYTAVSESTRSLRVNISLFVVISCTIGTILCTVLLRRNYQPLKQLAKITEPYRRNHAGEDADIYDKISDTLHTAISESTGWNDLWEYQRCFLTDRFVESALRGGISDNAVTREILASVGVTFGGSQFGVFTICPMELAGRSVSGLLPKLMPTFEEVRKSVGIPISLHWIELDGQIAVLYNLSPGSDRETLPRLQDRLALWAKQNELLAGFSNVYGSMDFIHVCYQEATEQLQQRRAAYLHGDAPEAAELSEQGPEFGLTVQQKEYLLSLITRGECDPAVDYLQQLLAEKNFHHPNGVRARSFAYAVIGAAEEAARLLPGGSAELTGKITRLSDELLQQPQVKSAALFRPLLDAVCRCFKPEESDRTQVLIQSIRKCVEEHYTEVDFNVTRLAELLNMNLSYLSKCFKASTGIGLHDYINRVRINRGKELITQRSLTVSEAARAVGFENINSFIRVFKKYEARTPGDYRAVGEDDVPAPDALPEKAEGVSGPRNGSSRGAALPRVIPRPAAGFPAEQPAEAGAVVETEHFADLADGQLSA